MSDIYTPRDPLTAYPRPPFPPQQQSGSGDTEKMDPVPDHGEQSYVGHGRLAGRRALITGADSGIGRAVAIAFAREGADVAIGYHTQEDDAKQTEALVRDAGRNAVLAQADIGDEEQCRALVSAAVEGLGGLDLLVMVAGAQATVDSIDDLETETLDRIMKTNVYSLFWLSKAAMEHFQPGAAIITTSSIQAFHPSPQLVEYATSKGAIANFTRAMAQQLAERGVRVNGVAPGPFWTPLQPATAPTEKLEHFGEQVPYGRPGQPAELASTFVYLASQESSYTSGETIIVNGGEPGH
ncbi:SDR family oxidoreductase [Salinibacterium sp. G-O1]|uniref:SDR family oxidoreductase n=1 Tax=Salinibacterium sp. G-O1 TaxID=3046208 RepID=UPI0024B891B6|nr:SDR family oxidoreductase [Salinibacterium sp. G-O1]MDJ0333880.1 SDR family oxidoreductase [Salinibacterium sp. G-O1]